MSTGKIYKITNLINNLNYIGCTIYKLEKRYNEHVYNCNKTDNNSKLYNSMRKYGVNNFKIELIEECPLNIIYETEKKYIELYDTYQNGLNTTLGGEGCLGYIHSPETRKKISENTKNGNSHKGKTYDTLYGINSEIEKEKRKKTVKENWESLSTEDRESRIKKLTEALHKKSKYGPELIKEIKNKLNDGMKISEFRVLFPNKPNWLYYQIRQNKRWKTI